VLWHAIANLALHQLCEFCAAIDAPTPVGDFAEIATRPAGLAYRAGACEVRHSWHRPTELLRKLGIGLSERRIEKMFDRFYVHRRPPELLRTRIGAVGLPNWSMMLSTNPVNAADAHPRCRSHCAHLKQAACVALLEPKTAWCAPQTGQPSGITAWRPTSDVLPAMATNGKVCCATLNVVPPVEASR
jgi:hypothetical protein